MNGMKTAVSAVLAAAMALSVSAAAFAAPEYEGEALKDTVKGFSDGSRSHPLDLTQRGGEVRVPFDLGGNAAYLSVEIDVNKGAKYLSASFDRGEGELVLTPKTSPRAKDVEYEVEVDVVDRKTKELVSGDYFLTGFLTYDNVQEAQDGKHYDSARGVLIDFGRGAKDVTVRAGHGVTLAIPKGPAGVVDFTMTGDGNAALDYMFSKHTLEYLNFASQPVFPSAVEVQVNSSAKYLYEYVDGRLRRVPGAMFRPGEGYTFTSKKLATLILTDDPLTEGVVYEDKHLILPR